MIFARAGEWITCENAHPICRMGRTVQYGDIVKLDVDFLGWTQAIPSAGDLAVWCAHCGAEFWKPGNGYHFADGWRPSNAGDWPAGWRLAREPKPPRPGQLRARLEALRRWFSRGERPSHD